MSGTPAKFLKKRGTVITSKVSLGYDVHHATVSQCLLRAATERAGLNEAVVHVDELGDYSISYRVTGTLADIEKLLDELHENQVEIVSPAFVAQRRIDANRLTIPKVASKAKSAARKRRHYQAAPTSHTYMPEAKIAQVKSEIESTGE